MKKNLFFNRMLIIIPMHEKQSVKDRASINFPWGIAYLASYMKESGIIVEVYDAQANQTTKEEVINKINKYNFDVVGISAFSTQYAAVKLFSEEIKKKYNVPVIVGGPLATYQPKMVLETTAADVCVIGEGEITIVQLLKNWKNLDKIDGIAYKNNDDIFQNKIKKTFISLDKIPNFDFNIFDMNKYLRQQNAYARKKNSGEVAISYITSRGCPYSCNFCSKSFQKYRAMSPETIKKMIRMLKKEFRIEEVSFNDELFLSNKNRFNELVNFFRRENINWGGQARVNLMDKDFLDLIKKGNCIGIGYGVESGSQQILNNMNKKTTVEQIEFAIKYTKKKKIPIKVQLIFGYPGENEKTILETIELFKRIDHPGRRFNVITPIPGSKLYSDSISNGLIKDEVKYLYNIEKSFGIGKVHVNFTKWPDDEIYPRKIAAENEMKKNYYNNNYVRRLRHEIGKIVR